MSGHSKWATTKHKKAANDAKRSNLWAKLIKNIEVAVRKAGDDINGNPTLYDAVQKAKKNSVPKSNIENAIKRGSGKESGGASYDEIIYEGYGTNGVALMIRCLTDNHNRAGSEVKAVLSKNGGSLGGSGSVSYMFNRKGQILLSAKSENGDVITEDKLYELILDYNVDDINKYDDTFEIITETNDLVKVREELQKNNIDYESAEITMVPNQAVNIDKDGFEKITKLIDMLDDLLDVQNVYSNFNYEEKGEENED